MTSGVSSMDRLDLQRLTERMTISPFVIATTAAAVSSAAVGGLFYAFSTFVMAGLTRAEPAQAIAAMRGINAEAQASAPFLVLFAGSALLALGVAVAALFKLSQPGTGYVLTGAALGLAAFVVTMAFNVPLNDRLDAVDPSGLPAADALREWRAYLGPWTWWNHVRTAAPLLGSVLMLVGLRYRSLP
ncbi:DUF1772 domain-containing protein [Mycobacterium hodleri]|uniref:DUF1772 domain-containing protein n=1 Tax=Mycolicibacterium hodleri TaxID=49897 RepID=A0A502DFG1_9MYCO|nr:DUF1772 domain-containing protein [Mycolicibacterium hodleri]